MRKFIKVIVLLVIAAKFTVGQVKLSRDMASLMAAEEIASQIKAQQNNALMEWRNKEITIRNKSMKFLYKEFGQIPKGGRSLYISLHGGGNVQTEVNDQQWRNQLELYSPAEGIYLVPRAPTDSWNLWHEPHIDDFLAQLIKGAIITRGVNPNKIYIMGYSAGGDGTFQLAPRMADYWAAAAMMAGHPGDASALNLKNLPFAIFMGGKDAAYQRNKLAVVWAKRLDSLQASAPGSYIHNVQIFPEMSHWMDRKDSIAIPWMASFIRNPLPKELAWHQDDRMHTNFYWLGMPDDKGNSHMNYEVIASIAENTITISKNDCPKLYIYLNDQMINLDRIVKVVYKGKVIFKRRLLRQASIIKETSSRLDKDLVFCARLTLEGHKITAFQ